MLGQTKIESRRSSIRKGRRVWSFMYESEVPHAEMMEMNRDGYPNCFSKLTMKFTLNGQRETFRGKRGVNVTIVSCQ